MLAARWALSTASTARTSFPTVMRTSVASTRSIFTPCGLPRASCGAQKRHRAIRSMSTYGKAISTPPDPMTGEEPVFAEPWEAHAFALAVKLSEAGFFTWSEWSEALAAELAAASGRGEPDDGSRYYHGWLAALERLVGEKNLVVSASLQARKEEWAEAY